MCIGCLLFFFPFFFPPILLGDNCFFDRFAHTILARPACSTT